LRKFYSTLSGFVLSKKIKFFCDGTLLIAASYLMLKKIFDFSMSIWLLDNVLHQTGVNLYLALTGVMLVSAIVIKFLSLMVEIFPPSKHSVVEPEEISDCISVMNKEILGHIKKCGVGQADVTKLNEQHAFEVNMRVITEALAEHVRKSIELIKVKRKDLFISVYRYENEKLLYQLHYDHKRDLVKSEIIDINDNQFSNYESVKCFNEGKSTSYVHKSKEYAKGASKRYKTIRHYLGCKLETNGHVVGFLNIEFHNNSVFRDEEEMQDFMEEHIYAFKLLYEYQYLKHEFFKKFTDFNKNWKVAS
jgi:hypothetical protein